ncbi:MAG: hypothetical protein ACXVJ7_14555 [Acidimicrobiia bacterium]
MRTEKDWGECPLCGGTASVTWLRSYTQARGARQRFGVRLDVRCLDPHCPGSQPDAG